MNNANAAAAETASKAIVLKRTNATGTWLQFIIIRDNAVAILDLTPAAWGGWNLRGLTEQGNDDWCGYSADSILAFKRATSDGCETGITAEETARALDLEARAPGILAARAS